MVVLVALAFAAESRTEGSSGEERARRTRADLALLAREGGPECARAWERAGQCQRGGCAELSKACENAYMAVEADGEAKPCDMGNHVVCQPLWALERARNEGACEILGLSHCPLRSREVERRYYHAHEPARRVGAGTISPGAAMAVGRALIWLVAVAMVAMALRGRRSAGQSRGSVTGGGDLRRGPRLGGGGSGRA